MINKGRKLCATDRKYICDICNVFFDNQTLLKKHFQKQHRENQLRCEICGRQCLNLSGLRNHKRRHNAEPTFIGVYKYLCEYCGKKFMRIEPFRTHKRTHFNEFPFECDVCRKKFAAADYLTVHKRRHIGDKRFACDICQKTFFSAYKVYVHKRIHTNERPYACDICGRRFHQKSSVKIHLSVHAGEKPVSHCVLKKKRSLLKLTTDELNSDEAIVEKKRNALMVENTNGGDIKCSQEKIFDDSLLKSKNNLVKLKTDEFQFDDLIVNQTNDTHKTYSRRISKFLLKKHLNNNHETFNKVDIEKDNVVDDFCIDLQMKDEKREILNVDLKINDKNKRQGGKKETADVDLFDVNLKQDGIYCLNSVPSCNFSEQDSVSYCDPSYPNNSENSIVNNDAKFINFRQHFNLLEIEDSNENYSADRHENNKSNQTAKNRSSDIGKQNILNCPDKNIKLNIKNTTEKPHDLITVGHANSKRVLFCDICQTTFAKPSLFVAHRKLHTKEKSFKCAICNLECRNLSGLTNHKRIHSQDPTYIGIYRYLCDICGKRFMRIGPFKTHKLTHTGELPFECDICTKKFAASDYLAIHKRRHAGDKRYECDVCHKKFFNSSKVIIHKRKHTGERPYPCDICGKKFFLRSSVVIHKTVHFKD